MYFPDDTNLEACVYVCVCVCVCVFLIRTYSSNMAVKCVTLLYLDLYTCIWLKRHIEIFILLLCNTISILA